MNFCINYNINIFFIDNYILNYFFNIKLGLPRYKISQNIYHSGFTSIFQKIKIQEIFLKQNIHFLI